ncbi:recombinase family protein [Chloroflexota bacterium]
MKTAAIYCRVSTEDQEREGTSLISQCDACVLKASELGYEVPNDLIFSEAWTGTDMDRPKLIWLRQMIRDSLIEAVVCYSTDRLARNPIHIAIVAEECQKRGIDLIFVTEPLDYSPEGQLIQYVRGFAAQIEHEKIRERTMRGKRTGVLSGKISTGSPQLYGYHQANGIRSIIENEANIVKRIFSKIAIGGYSPGKMASELNLAGILAPKGGRWSDGAIYRMTKNSAYTGLTYAYRYRAVEPKIRKKDTSRKETSRKAMDRSQWIEVPNATPAIINRDTFQLVQNQLERNRHKTPHNKKHSYLFNNGRLRCGVCGRSMVASARERKGGYYYVYRCISNTKPDYYGRCEQESIRADTIEPLVWHEVSQLLAQPELVLSQLDMQRGEKMPIALEADRILIENNITSTVTEEQRYLRQYGKGLINEKQLEDEIQRVRKYRGQQEAKLTELNEQIQAYEQANINYSQFSEALAMIAGRLKGADHEVKQLALQALDIQVTLQSGHTIAIKGLIPTSVQHTTGTSPHAGLPGCRSGLGGVGGLASYLI